MATPPVTWNSLNWRARRFHAIPPLQFCNSLLSVLHNRCCPTTISLLWIANLSAPKPSALMGSCSLAQPWMGRGKPNVFVAEKGGGTAKKWGLWSNWRRKHFWFYFPSLLFVHCNPPLPCLPLNRALTPVVLARYVVSRSVCIGRLESQVLFPNSAVKRNLDKNIPRLF